MPRGRCGYRPDCTYPGCSKPNAAKGLCRSHYQRWRKTGDPEGGTRRVQVGVNLMDKLTNKFLRGIRKMPSGCWVCETGYADNFGYLVVQISENGVQHSYKSHRFSYEYFVGSIPDGKLVCHKCDVPSCCNPEHLFLGSQSENMQDMVRKGRGLVGGRNANTKFTEADILAIYRDVDLGLSREAIAKKFNVSAVTISHIATGRNWKHLYERHRFSTPV